MRKSIFKERFFVFFFLGLAVFFVTLLGCLLLLLKIENQEIRSIQKYNSGYLLADELRQSSDDLTKAVRLYVLTGNPRYVQQYDEILSIREGLSPLPEDYNQIYWDLVLSNEVRPRPYKEARSLRKRIKEEGFTKVERNLLTEAQDHSELLSKWEKEAIYAMKGKFKDAGGLYSIEGPSNAKLAMQLVSSDAYMKQKALVMKPLQMFYDEFDRQMDLQSKQLEIENKGVIFISIALLAGLAFCMIFFLHKALKSLTKAVEANEHLLLSALPEAISERLKQGEESSVNESEACILFLDVEIDSGDKGAIASLLQPLYGELDLLTERYKVERIRTLQGTYMVASGISGPPERYVEKLADFALAAKEKIHEWGEAHQFSLYIKAGMASGTVIAGILDEKKYIYDLWGDVLKVASRLESNGVKGEIQITKKMASQLKGSFDLVERQDGEEKIYFLRKKIIL